MQDTILAAFSDELEKIAVSEAFIAKHLTSALGKQVAKGEKGSAMFARRFGRASARTERWGAKRGKSMDAFAKAVGEHHSPEQYEAAKQLLGKHERHGLRGMSEVASGNRDKTRTGLNLREKKRYEAALSGKKRSAPASTSAASSAPEAPPRAAPTGKSSDVSRPGGIPPGKAPAEGAAAPKPVQPAASTAPASSSGGKWKKPAAIAGGVAGLAGVGAMIHRARSRNERRR